MGVKSTLGPAPEVTSGLWDCPKESNCQALLIDYEYSATANALVAAHAGGGELSPSFTMALPAGIFGM